MGCSKDDALLVTISLVSLLLVETEVGEASCCCFSFAKTLGSMLIFCVSFSGRPEVSAFIERAGVPVSPASSSGCFASVSRFFSSRNTFSSSSFFFQYSSCASCNLANCSILSRFACSCRFNSNCSRSCFFRVCSNSLCRALSSCSRCRITNFSRSAKRNCLASSSFSSWRTRRAPSFSSCFRANSSSRVAKSSARFWAAAAASLSPGSIPASLGR
mmetsp:Transcript_22828/g.27930  ORF Transcript_22828/g.27930 Transcript_22828/m.27930 type:complete len:216 (+) Transcript_22828:1025-1672(+)